MKMSHRKTILDLLTLRTHLAAHVCTHIYLLYGVYTSRPAQQNHPISLHILVLHRKTGLRRHPTDSNLGLARESEWARSDTPAFG